MEVGLDDRHDHDGFWETLDETIEEILTEVDRMIAFGWMRQQTIIGHHRADNRPRIKANEHDRPTIMLDCVDDSYETDDLRRPQEEDEYWSISATTWSRTSRARQTLLSHVGRINETSEGEQAPDGDCNKCAESGSECMMYRNPGCHGERIAGGISCSRCRFRSLACSYDATDNVAVKKRKTVNFEDSTLRRSKRQRGPDQTSRTHSRGRV
jgi:hypothetical protein